MNKAPAGAFFYGVGWYLIEAGARARIQLRAEAAACCRHLSKRAAYTVKCAGGD